MCGNTEDDWLEFQWVPNKIIYPHNHMSYTYNMSVNMWDLSDMNVGVPLIHTCGELLICQTLMNRCLVSLSTIPSPNFQNRKSPIRFKIHVSTIEEAIQDHKFEPTVSQLCMASKDSALY